MEALTEVYLYLFRKEIFNAHEFKVWVSYLLGSISWLSLGSFWRLEQDPMRNASVFVLLGKGTKVSTLLVCPCLCEIKVAVRKMYEMASFGSANPVS